MRKSFSTFILAVTIAGSASANPMVANFPNDPPYIPDPLAHVYHGEPRYSATQVLAKLRAVCNSRDTTDKRACSRGMTVLKSAHNEMLTRRAAQHAVAD